MSEHNGIPQSVAVIAATLQQRAVQAAAVQSALGKKLGEINQHWLERIQEDSTEVWQLLFKVGRTPAVGEKIKLCEHWVEGAMKKAADDATYILENARALGQIEMRFLSSAKLEDAHASAPAPAVENS